MAEQITEDVVNQAQPVGDSAPSGAPAETTSNTTPGEGDETKLENGIHVEDDIAARSDTDTSRADGSLPDDAKDPKLAKKFVAVKPVSYAKYSVPKVIAASVATKGVEKVPTPTTTTPSLQLSGRPRLVAKTSAAAQTNPRPFKPAAPDPNQVWNKNRVTPQPSTKNLTDEELAKQYGIHMASRLQSDGDGKEANWADIDDDEEDWAPEVIEWNDGTKSTLKAAAVTPTFQEPAKDIDVEVENTTVAKPIQQKPPLTPQHSLGPNAIVLKLGANAEKQLAEKQMAQKAASQQKGPNERTQLGSKTAPAPPPVKSPWASLPPVEKASPILINPQMQPPQRFSAGYGYAQSPASINAPSPAKEISADDFNRSWRDNQTNQPRELFMPNSGTYQPVPETKRRMSKNDSNFRAPALLQRPGQMDAVMPAEPSAAFQTSHTSSDQARRRASSTMSGSSGQLLRRMSMKSGEAAVLSDAGTAPSLDSAVRPESRDGTMSTAQTPSAYQARRTDSLSGDTVPATDTDIEAQRAAQKAMMKEKIELARKRKVEEEEERQRKVRERIALKLAALGPDPRTLKKESSEPAVEAVQESTFAQPLAAQEAPQTGTSLTISPPKPPQPLATGEPQQYGMMKVHPMNASHKKTSPTTQAIEPPIAAQVQLPPSTEQQAETSEFAKTAPLPVNGVDPDLELPQTHLAENVPISEPSPHLAKAPTATPDMRAGWGDLRKDNRPGSSNLWSLPHHNKALGNGTFDQNLAGYARQEMPRGPQSTQAWMSGRTPLNGRSPQLQHVNHATLEPRSPLLPSLVSPDQQPLAIGSEADSMFPATRPAPIAPPHVQAHQAANGIPQSSQANLTAGWNNFAANANQQERAESEIIQREVAMRREEDLRNGRVHTPQYTLHETFKQVQLGDSAGQRQLSGISQSLVGPGHHFGAIGSLPGGNNARGSRFFPPLTNGYPQDRRAFTYSHPEPPRSPSPPPAEDFESAHPAFDGDSRFPVIHFPPTKPVVKLPPALPPTPPSPEPAQLVQQPSAPLTWAARVSMPAPTPPAQLRSVSTPIAQTASWQERFNGLLGKPHQVAPDTPSSEVMVMNKVVEAPVQVASSTRELLEDLPLSTAVSLPTIGGGPVVVRDIVELLTTKDVEKEDDLFEDREPGSLPIINLPHDVAMQRPPFRRVLPRALLVDPTSAEPFFYYNPFEKHVHKHFNDKTNAVFVQLPGMLKSKRINITPTESPNGMAKQRNSSYNNKHHRGGMKAGPPRSRQVTPKAQQA